MIKIKLSKARSPLYREMNTGLRSLLMWTVLLSMLVPVSSPAAEPGANEVGIRMGIQSGGKTGHFLSYEAFAAHRLSWDWRAASGWGVVPQVTSSLGLLQGAGDEAVFATAGIGIILDKNGPGVSMDSGISPLLMNRYRFGHMDPGSGHMDFGSTLQFVSHGGINYRFDSGLKIGYRWQHMSNGHIFYPSTNPNPGLNMHIFGISYVQ